MHLTALSLVLASAGFQTGVYAPRPDSTPPTPLPARSVQAVRLSAGAGVSLDGVLTDAAWQRAVPFSQFTQRDPDQGAAPTESTVVWVTYDDAALYVAARLYDREPAKIVARLGRRDQHTNSDAFVVFLDPYFDRRSGFFFGVNAAGTQYDGVMYNDDWDDNTWDGVWESKVAIDSLGWSVEMRIPYSQLRFVQKETYVWGINLRRDIARRNEFDYLVYTPRNQSGFVSRFAELTGIQNVTPPRRVELMPYSTARAEYTNPPGGDPFNDGSRYVPGVGVDFRMGLGSNLTVNGTVNPDFGQVEVDP
ncbi:MAG: carbohydrate binding family 9 domain-containing protein, partial [Gemmatimonadales bacterium]